MTTRDGWQIVRIIRIPYDGEVHQEYESAERKLIWARMNHPEWQLSLAHTSMPLEYISDASRGE